MAALQNTKRLHLKFRLGMNVVQSPPTQRASSMAILVQGCTGHQEQQMPFPAFIEPEKRASSTDAEKPFIIELEHTILKLQSLSKVLGRFLLFTFF